ncbi:MAG: nucleotide exchange factor GrpE [Candidatus Nomurabacteria bacterium]
MNEEEVKKEERDIDDKREDDFEDLTFVDSTEDGEALPTKDITKKLREELKTCRKEKEEYLTGWQRAKADYINLQKELDSTRLNISIVAREKMARNLMPALDSFDMAFQNKESWEKVDPNWRMGVEYIYSQFMTGLADSGIEKIDQIGVKFDPNLHHSISAVETEKEEQDHTIESIIQVGYKIGERVVRPARVNIYEYKK